MEIILFNCFVFNLWKLSYMILIFIDLILIRFFFLKLILVFLKKVCDGVNEKKIFF